jgi:hypothetical protein
MHADIITAAAKAGKHIFCEKPISMDLKETIQVLEIVKEICRIWRCRYSNYNIEVPKWCHWGY